MQRVTKLAALMLCLAGSSAVVCAENPLSQWDVESMYVQARAMLEDRSIQNVESVPMLLETCAREGHAEAARLLLDVYEGKFKGLEARPGQALHLARSLASPGRHESTSESFQQLRTEAMYRLALYLEKGYGAQVNKEEAYTWMQRAARRGMPAAIVEEARYLMNGTGTSPDPRKAWQQLHQQAKKNPDTPHLFFYMGHMCQHGIGMPRNARKAFELYRMGATLDDSQCLNNLGTMFENGYPTPRNYETAYRLYRKSAYLGNKEASANMQRLAFREDIHSGSSTPLRKRIDNATLRVIQALPVSHETQQQLMVWLTRSEN